MSNFTFKVLQHGDLTKRGGDRLKVFSSKIGQGQQFVTAKGVVVFEKTQLVNGQKLDATALLRAMDRPGFSAVFKGKNDKGVHVTVTYPKDFYKTPEFGGKGSGFGTKAEDAALVLFRDKINMAKGSNAYIKIKINNRIVNVADIISTVGPGGGKNTPKSDFTLVDAMGKEVAWISHKAGRRAADFQQYGGLTADDFINRHLEVKNFMSALDTRCPGGLKSGETFWRTITSDKLDQHSVYGKDFGGRPGIFNCDEFHLGEMKLVKSGMNYEITSLHKGTNGDVSTGEFASVFIARYDSASYTAGGVTIKHCRVGIFPKGKVPKNAMEI